MATKLGTIVADFQTALSTKVGVGGTNVNIQSITDDDGDYLIDGQYYFTIDGDNSSKEHIICTLSTPTSLLTDIKSVSRQGVESIGVAREHRVGATVTITDHAHLKAMNDLLSGAVGFVSTSPLKYDASPTFANAEEVVDKNYVDSENIKDVHLTGNQSIDGVKTFTSLPVIPTPPLANTDAASKKYVDDTASFGAPDASITTKGISQYATAAEIIAGSLVSIEGGGSPIVVNPKYLKDAGITPSSDVVTLLLNSVIPVDPAGALVATRQFVGNNLMIGAQVYIPYAITINKISFNVNVVGTHGTLKMGLYTEDGQTKVFEHTTADINATVLITETLAAPVSITPGIYYLMILPIDTADITLYVFNTINDTYSILGAVTGEPIISGSAYVTDLSASANNLPTLFDPTTDITFSEPNNLFGRLDN